MQSTVHQKSTETTTRNFVYRHLMSDIHKRIEAYGRQGALDLTSSDAERRAVDAALGFLYSGWCQTGRPHRRLDDDQIWLLETSYVRLMVEPGSVKRDGVPARIGVPYGSRARLILLFFANRSNQNK